MSKSPRSDWGVQPLGKLAESRRGITYSSEMLESQDEGLPYINMKSFLKEGGFNPGGTKRYAGSYRQNDLVGESDLLIANTDVTSGDIVGVPALLPEELSGDKVLYSHHVTRLRLNSGVTVPFLYYLLCLPEYRSQMLRIARGTTVLMLDMHAIKRIPIRAPKVKAEQDRIAEILSTLDEAIEQTEALIAKHQQIKVGLMHDLFTRGVTPDGHLRPTREQAPDLYKESQLGWIPKEWELSRCYSEFVIDSGITLGPHRRPNKSPYPYLRVANVYRDRIVLDDVTQLEATLEEIEAERLKCYDLLVVEGHANRNEIGRCAMVFNDAEGMLFQNHLFRLRAIRLDPRYSLLWLNSSRVQRYWDSMCSTSSGLNTINRRLLGKMPVLIPSQEEQRLIADIVFSCREEETTNAIYLAKLRQQKQGLMHDLLTGRVPVPEGTQYMDLSP